MNHARGKSILLGSILLIAMVALAAATALLVRAALAVFLLQWRSLGSYLSRKPYAPKRFRRLWKTRKRKKNRQMIATLNMCAMTG